MYKVVLTSLVTGESWSAIRNTEAEIQAWLDIQTAKPDRNIVPQWYREDVLTGAQIATATDERFIEISEDVYVKEYQLPAQATKVTTDITSEIAKKEARDTQQNEGDILRSLCKRVLNIIAGYSLRQNFTTEQINSFRNQYATIVDYLNARMAISAKPLIDAVVVDGVIIKQTLTDSINLEYQDFYTAYPEIFT
jgi:hypothetical protein